MKKKKNSKYGMPEKVIFCKKCVISNQRPSSSVEIKSSNPFNKTGISFEEDGICLHVNFMMKSRKILIGNKERRNF